MKSKKISFPFISYFFSDPLPLIFSFFNDFLFYYSFYVTFFMNHGFSGGDLAILLIIMNASKMIADIPIGIMSDTISRRNILILGLLFRCIFCVLCLFGNSFLTFAIAMFVVGCGNSCLWTHTWNYFYDYLKEQKKEAIFSRFMGKFYAVSNVAIASAAFTGEHIYNYLSFNGIFTCSIVSLIFAGFIMFNLPNYKPKKTLKTAKNLKVSNSLHFFSLILELLKKPRILRMLLLTILMDSMFIVFLDINTTIMNNAGILPKTITQIVGVVAFIRIFSNYFSGKTEKVMSFKRMHSMLLVLMIISIVASFYNTSAMIFVVSAYLCVYPFFDTSIKTKIEHKLDSNTRATVLGIASLFVSVLTIIFNSVIGIVAEKNGYFAAPVCIFIIVITILFCVRNLQKFYRVDLVLRRFLLKVRHK